MRLIIAGSRTIKITPKFIDEILIQFKINKKKIIKVVCGKAKGVDDSGHAWAIENDIRVKAMKPNYDEYGRYDAPKKRNVEMSKCGDRLVLIWDGRSGGSYHMKQCMIDLKKPVHEIIIK